MTDKRSWLVRKLNLEERVNFDGYPKNACDGVKIGGDEMTCGTISHAVRGPMAIFGDTLKRVSDTGEEAVKGTWALATLRPVKAMKHLAQVPKRGFEILYGPRDIANWYFGSNYPIFHGASRLGYGIGGGTEAKYREETDKGVIDELSGGLLKRFSGWLNSKIPDRTEPADRGYLGRVFHSVLDIAARPPITAFKKFARTVEIEVNRRGTPAWNWLKTAGNLLILRPFRALQNLSVALKFQGDFVRTAQSFVETVIDPFIELGKSTGAPLHALAGGRRAEYDAPAKNTWFDRTWKNLFGSERRVNHAAHANNVIDLEARVNALAEKYEQRGNRTGLWSRLFSRKKRAAKKPETPANNDTSTQGSTPVETENATVYSFADHLKKTRERRGKKTSDSLLPEIAGASVGAGIVINNGNNETERAVETIDQAVEGTIDELVA